MVFWIRASVSASMEAVASSKRMILELRSKALAIQISCLWPTEKFSPFSITCASSFPSSFEINFHVALKTYRVLDVALLERCPDLLISVFIKGVQVVPDCTNK